MADLQKLFVLVSTTDTDAFKSKYVTAGESRLTDYDSKIVFLEGTNEIFTNGRLFGLNNLADIATLTALVNALDAYIGEIPAGATSTDIVNYIKEYVDGSLAMTPVTAEEIDALFN